MTRTIMVLLVAVTAATFGDIFLSRAMRAVGEVKLTGLRSLLRTALRVLATPTFWLALGLMASFFFLWLSLLSWAELSMVLPMTALTYALNALLAGPMLGERVSPARWAGTLLIVAGVAIVAYDGHLREGAE